jgi:hypothetical protein
MKSDRYISISIVLIVFVAIIAIIAWTGIDRWRGGGFSPTAPEMPRLRQVLNLKAGMSVADVGAGGGDLTLALAPEVGPAGRIFSSGHRSNRTRTNSPSRGGRRVFAM